METIEIGAVVIDLNNVAQLETFQVYIKPVVHPQLTSFCTELTGIEQSQVDNASYFYDAINQFSSWINSYSNIQAWASWGAYDRNQFEQDCKRHHQLNILNEFHHLNLKTAYAASVNTRSKGMANALKEQNIDLIGRHHSGLDDAINIMRLLQLTPKFEKHVKSLLR